MSPPTPNPRFLLVGGPGAGKTSALAALRSMGFACLPDAAREIIRQRLGAGLPPRPEPTAFARQVLDSDKRQYDQATVTGEPVFFERGVPDSLGMLLASGGFDMDLVRAEIHLRPYNPGVFYFPPWRDIYTTDAERDQNWPDAERIGAMVREWYASLGFTIVEVPFASPAARAEHIERLARTIISGTLPVSSGDR